VLERRSALTLLRGVVTSDTADDVAWADRWTAAFAFLTEADREVLRLVAWRTSRQRMQRLSSAARRPPSRCVSIERGAVLCTWSTQRRTPRASG